MHRTKHTRQIDRNLYLLVDLDDVLFMPYALNVFLCYFSYPRGDVFAQLDLAMKKLERLMKEVGATTGDSTIKDKLHNTEFQVNITVHLKSHCTPRILL